MESFKFQKFSYYVFTLNEHIFYIDISYMYINHISVWAHTHITSTHHTVSIITDSPAMTGETPSQRLTMAMTLQVTHSVISSSHPPPDKEIERPKSENTVRDRHYVWNHENRIQLRFSNSFKVLIIF